MFCWDVLPQRLEDSKGLGAGRRSGGRGRGPVFSVQKAVAKDKGLMSRKLIQPTSLRASVVSNLW